MFGPSQFLYLRAHYNTGNANPSYPTGIGTHDRTHLFLRDFVSVGINYYLLMRQQFANNVKLSLCTPRCTRGEGVSTVELHSLLTSTLHGDEWSASCLGRFTRALEKRTLACTGNRIMIPGVFSPYSSHYTDYTVPVANKSVSTEYRAYVLMSQKW